MKIEIIGKQDLNIAVKAWNFSNRQKKMNRLDLLKADMPVTDLCIVTAKIKSSIFEREIFATLRDHVIWAKSARDYPIEDFTAELSGTHGSYYEAYRQNIKDCIRDGIPQERYCLLLPIMAHCEYNIKLSIRSLMRLYKSISQYEWPEEMKYIKLKFMQGLEEMIRTCINRTEFQLFYESIKPMPLLEAENIVTTNSTMAGGKVITLTDEVSFSTRTHFARHRELILSDNLGSLLYANKIPVMQLMDPVLVQVTGQAEYMGLIFSKRSCWLNAAHQWQRLIKKYENLTGSYAPLPCNNEIGCPYSLEAEYRRSGEYKAAECPRYAQLNKFSLSNESISEIHQDIAEYGRSDYWKKIIHSFNAGSI